MRFAILGIAAIALVACGSDEESFFQEWDVDDPEALELSSDGDDTESSGSGAQTRYSSSHGTASDVLSSGKESGGNSSNTTGTATSSMAASANSSGSNPTSSFGTTSSTATYSSGMITTPSSSSASNGIVPDSRDDLLNRTVGYSVLTDSRDGKRYRAVVVAGRTWMAENLNFSDESYNPLLKGNTRCYANDEKNCDVMGRLYNRAAALNDQKCAFGNSCAMGNGNVQGACPSGWHVPTLAEAQALVDLAGNATVLRSAKGWAKTLPQGTDTYGIAFAGTGLWDESFDGLGEKTYAWVYHAAAPQHYILIKGDDNSVAIKSFPSREVYIPLRCVKDVPLSSSSIIKSSSSYSSSSSKVSSSSYSSSSKVSSSSGSNRTKLNYTATYSIPTKGAQFNPNINYGTMTDPRDGKTYRTIDVDGKTWMAENLDYAGTTIGSSYCFNMDDRFCNIYGRLYDREAAVQDSKCTYTAYCNLGKDTVQGICPDGWHIPLRSEGQRLTVITNGKAAALEALKGWGNDTLTVTNAKDSLGLSFIGGGDLVDATGFRDIGAYSFTWLHDESNTQTYLLIRAKDDESLVRGFKTHKTWFSVRCVKNP